MKEPKEHDSYPWQYQGKRENQVAGSGKNAGYCLLVIIILLILAVVNRFIVK